MNSPGFNGTPKTRIVRYRFEKDGMRFILTFGCNSTAILDNFETNDISNWNYFDVSILEKRIRTELNESGGLYLLNQEGGPDHQ
jgi:hypothetical protein